MNEEREGACGPADGPYVLHLYVTGMTPRAREAIRNIRHVCEENLRGRYELKVIDIYQQPELAKQEQLVAVPTLVRKRPLPLRRMVGDLSNKERVMAGLNITPCAGRKEEGDQ